MGLALVACGGSATAASCPDVAPAATSTTPLHDDPELEERIPNAVAGEPFEVQSYCATTSDPGGINTAPEFLEAVGVELADVTVLRSAGPEIGNTDAHAEVVAFRYRGADEDTLRETFIRMFDESNAELGLEDELPAGVIAGKEVHLSRFVTIYVADDAIYLLSGADSPAAGAKIEEILKALP